jgi:uncharacterized membrane protein
MTGASRSSPRRRRHPLTLALGRKLAPPRFLAFLALLPLASYAHYRLFPPAALMKSLAIGFDVAAAVFLVSLVPLLRRSGAEEIRERADANAANRWVVLLVSTLLTVVIMAAIAGELPAARHGDMGSIVQLVVTLLLIWLFANSVYALHYAHDYYSGHPALAGKDCGGLDFPDTASPGYADFAYFAFTLGMTFQTSDVATTATRVRMVVLLHCFGAFLFNIGVIAFTINALGGG